MEDSAAVKVQKRKGGVRNKVGEVVVTKVVDEDKNINVGAGQMVILYKRISIARARSTVNPYCQTVVFGRVV